MNDAVKTKAQLINELTHLRQRVADLEAADVECKQLHSEMTAINTNTVATGQSLELDHIVNTALDKVLELTGAAAGRVQLYSNGNGQNDRVTELFAERGFDGNQTKEETNWARIDIPITAQGRVLGEIAIFNRPSHPWIDQDVHLLTRIEYELGTDIANTHLFDAFEEQKQQYRPLGMRLVEAEEAERRRLARMLHDQVGQSLTAMGINVDIIQTLLPEDISEEIISRLDDMRGLVTRTTKRVRQVMVDLRPEMLDDYGILAALHWSAEQFTRRTGISVNVEGEEAAGRLPAQVENVLYRVAQEALTNVVKHAQATQVRVCFKVDSEMVTLVVSDNGIGFSPERRFSRDQGHHWGLDLMAERIEGVNGRFQIESTPGQGTRIIVEVLR